MAERTHQWTDWWLTSSPCFRSFFLLLWPSTYLVIYHAVHLQNLIQSNPILSLETPPQKLKSRKKRNRQKKTSCQGTCPESTICNFPPPKKKQKKNRNKCLVCFRIFLWRKIGKIAIFGSLTCSLGGPSRDWVPICFFCFFIFGCVFLFFSFFVVFWFSMWAYFGFVFLVFGFLFFSTNIGRCAIVADHKFHLL